MESKSNGQIGKMGEISKKRRMEREHKEEMDEIDAILSSPPKKRKISNGDSQPLRSPTVRSQSQPLRSQPVKLDKESQREQLKLLKRRMALRAMRKTTPKWSSARSNMSMSSSSSTSPYGSVQLVRRRSGSKLIGRRSHTLQLAAKGTLCSSPRSVCFEFLINSFFFLYLSIG